MNQELDDKLVKAYPELFVNRYADASKSAMCWGFDCGDGWYKIIDAACKMIQGHVKWNNSYHVKDPDRQLNVVAAQVKEKFGTLRFYVDGGDDYVYGIIAMAEAMSYVTCETCGSSSGKLRSGSWVITRCDACMERDHSDRFKLEKQDEQA